MFDHINIDKILDKQHNDFCARVENWKYEKSNVKNRAMFLLKGFNRFTTNKTKHHGKNVFVGIAYNASACQQY